MKPTFDFKLLSTFVRAANVGTIKAAAAQVGRTQPAVTQQIQRLEDILGQSLFHRSGSGVQLTGSGKRFLEYAQRMLSLHDEAMSEFSGRALRGSIVFGSPEDYLSKFFPTLLSEFGRKYPDVDVKVVSAPTVDLRPLLNARQIDLALVSTPNASETPDALQSEQLVWLGSKATLDLHGFGEVTPLALHASNTMDHQAACQAMSRAGLPYKISYASNSLTGQIAVTRSGLAISVVTPSAVPSDLFVLGDPLPPLPRLGIVLAFADSERSLAVETFGNHIRHVLPSLGSGLESSP